ncbi:EAL domain-containing protein [Thalassotalea atypica]|uniref:EAL domain-containing protein n=1 Tax=Thalassotalea atypica TaxID=2054316 RepID=UPI002574640C|nr:EAL domain-containing protein [Thalassotalea atypica]
MGVLKAISWKLNRLNIKTKLLCFLLVPFATLTLITINQIQDHYVRLVQVNKNRDFVNISSKLESLIFALQQERGISEAFIGSKGRLFNNELIKKRAETDEQLVKLKQLVQSLLSQNLSLETLNESISVEQEFKRLMENSKALYAQRQKIDKYEAPNSFEYYSQFITTLIDSVEKIQFATNSIDQLRLINQFTNLLWLQEHSGRERGAINGLLSTSAYNNVQLQHILSYSNEQDKIIDRLLSAQNEHVSGNIRAQLLTDEYKEIVNIRKKLQQKIDRNPLMLDLMLLLSIDSLSDDFNEYAEYKSTTLLKKIIRKLSKAHLHLEQIAIHYVTNATDTHALNTIEQQLTKLEYSLELIQSDSALAQVNIDKVIQVEELQAALLQLHELNITIENEFWWDITTSRIKAFQDIAAKVQENLLLNVQINQQKSTQSVARNLLLMLFTLVLSLLLSYLIFKRVAGEIEKISTKILQMKQTGNFDQKLTVSGDDELTQIAISYNELLDEREHSERQTRISAAVFEHASEAILISDAQNNIQLVNPAFTKITGYTLEEVKGKNPKILQSGRHGPEFYQQMWNSLLEDGRWQSEIWNKRKNGEVYPEFIALSVVKDINGNIVQHISMFSDITQYKQYEQDIWYQANHDALTDLPNRNLFLDRLRHEIEMQPRSEKKLTVMFIDLDRFKFVNDTYGHSYGDELIITIANRLTECLRKSDTVSRFGGDEFVVLSSNINGVAEIKSIALKILKEAAKPIKLSNGQEAIVSASIGITIYPDDAHSVEELVKHADTAMYQAKDEGKNTFCFYMPEMNIAVTEQMQLELELRRAVKNREFTLHYQPVLSLKDNCIIGAEALIRWNHPTKGMIFPDVFIPRAEESGLIVEIGEQVLEQAALAICLLHDLDFSIHVAVNVSGRQCISSNKKPIEDVIADTIAKFDLDPHSLKIEITESMLLEDSQHVKNTLQAIRDLNVDIYMDDFGTGYSSLSYLKQFPIDVLKIDRSFIWKMLEDDADASLVEAIVMIGRSLDLRLVAEGVETQAHLEHMQALHCEYAQGYHISKPLELESFITFLKNTDYIIK